MSKSKKILPLSWKGIILSIIVIAVFGFIGAKSTFDYIYCKELQTAINKGIVVEAEIVGLVHNSGVRHGGGSIYNVMYRYIDEEGIIYESYCGRGNYETEEEARKLIGEKVAIYIGGIGSFSRPLCRAVSFGTKVDVSKYIILMSVFYSAILVYIVLVIIYCLFFYDKLPMSKKKKTDNTENE